MNNFEYDFNQVDDDFLNSIFLDRVKLGEPSFVGSILNNPLVIKRINPACFNLAVVASITLQTLDMFHTLYEYLPKDDDLLQKTIQSKIFNSVCLGNGSELLKRLKELDEKIGLSKMMMEDNLTINEIEIAKVENLNYPRFIGVRIPYGEHEEEFRKSWNEHGFIVASKNGNDKLIKYLISASKNIPTNIIEAGFISACKEQQFETASNLYSHLGSIEQSQFIQNYINSIDNDDGGNTKSFISKLVLKEQLDNDLPLNETTTNQNKIKM